MNLKLRPGSIEDAGACGQICFDAFSSVANHHRFPPDFPSADVAVGLMSMLLTHPGFYSVVAEIDGRVVGSNFLDERSAIAGVGPITVDPGVQNSGAGRRLMMDVLERAQQRGAPGVRLLQAAYHNRSLSLYAKLGFEIREPISTMQGPPIHATFAGVTVRPATQNDVDACNRLCRRVHGHDRQGELMDGLKQGSARVVERDGRVTGYTTLMGFFGHSVGETNDDLKALIADASEYPGPGFLLPARNGELLRWCLSKGLRVVQPMTLMTVGLYNEPAGPYLPSILY
jgi:GNAT superfamily N-acetyltransferase